MNVYDRLKQELNTLDNNLTEEIKALLKGLPNKYIRLNDLYTTRIDDDIEEIEVVSLIGDSVILLETLDTETYNLRELNTTQKFELFRQMSLELNKLSFEELTNFLPETIKLCDIEVEEIIDTLQAVVEYQNDYILDNELENIIRQKGGDIIEDLIDGLRETLEERNIPTSNMEDVIWELQDEILDRDTSKNDLFNKTIYLSMGDLHYELTIGDVLNNFAYNYDIDHKNVRLSAVKVENVNYQNYKK